MLAAPAWRNNHVLWLWVPAFAGTTLNLLKRSRLTADVSSTLRRHRRDRRERAVGFIAELIGWPLVDALAIGLRDVADADAVGDRPVEAGREQDIGTGEVIAHQVGAAVAKRSLDMA